MDGCACAIAVTKMVGVYVGWVCELGGSNGS